MADKETTKRNRSAHAKPPATPLKAKAPASVGQVALVLQGGGALGAYQVGVFRALHEDNYRPDWFAGTSIGAINAAIMAGNAPEDRLQKLEEFWGGIARNAFCWPLPSGPLGRQFRAWSAWQTMVMGQPGFFRSRAFSPWLAAADTPAAMSYYATDELRHTLERVVDLERINRGSVRLSLGAVKVPTGVQVYFDSREQPIGYEHIMASAALPPAFPPIEVDGDWYWDGGIVSNTPLDVIIDQLPRRSTLCFMVDLFDASGPMPRTMGDIEARHKDIMYASRSSRSIEAHRIQHNLRRAIMALWNALPAGKQKESHLSELADMGCTTTMHIVRLVHRTEKDELSSKDYDFSKSSMLEHMASGYRDARQMLKRQPWRDPVPLDIGVLVHEAPVSGHTLIKSKARVAEGEP